MHKWTIVLLIVLAVILIGMVVLYFIGRRMQKKQEEAMPDILAGAQLMSMLIIDKKRMKLSEAGFPPIVMEQASKLMKRAKVPVVKAKVGPRIMNLMCSEEIFDDVPLKKEVKAKVNGIYIIEVKGIRSTAKPEEEQKKKGFFSRAKKEAIKMSKEKKK